VRVVAVDVEPAEARPFVERLAREARLTLPVALGGSEVAERYRVDNLPHVVVVAADGTIRRVLLGMHDQAELSDAVEQALK
jgi:hypothetical protein